MQYVDIREIGNSYREQVINLILPIQTEEFNVNLKLEDQPDLLSIDQFYRRDNGNFWGAFDEDHLIGTIGLIRYHPTEVAIRKMFVKKDYRGKEKGVAAALLHHLIQYCKALGIKNIYLGTVHILHAAHRFYEKSGFEKISLSELSKTFPQMPAEDRYYHFSIE